MLRLPPASHPAPQALHWDSQPRSQSALSPGMLRGPGGGSTLNTGWGWGQSPHAQGQRGMQTPTAPAKLPSLGGRR